jgi:hypothetical protein
MIAGALAVAQTPLRLTAEAGCFAPASWPPHILADLSCRLLHLDITLRDAEDAIDVHRGDLRRLYALKALQSLRVHFSNTSSHSASTLADTAVDPADGLPALQSLTLQSAHTSYVDYMLRNAAANSSHLTALYLTAFDDTPERPSELPAAVTDLKSLQQLSVTCQENLHRLPPLSALLALTQLDISSNDNLTQLRTALTGCTALRVLRTIEASRINDDLIATMGILPSLRQLYVALDADYTWGEGAYHLGMLTQKLRGTPVELLVVD